MELEKSKILNEEAYSKYLAICEEIGIHPNLKLEIIENYVQLSKINGDEPQKEYESLEAQEKRQSFKIQKLIMLKKTEQKKTKRNLALLQVCPKNNHAENPT